MMIQVVRKSQNLNILMNIQILIQIKLINISLVLELKMIIFLANIKIY